MSGLRRRRVPAPATTAPRDVPSTSASMRSQANEMHEELSQDLSHGIDDEDLEEDLPSIPIATTIPRLTGN